jgi:hypothetical protein
MARCRKHHSNWRTAVMKRRHACRCAQYHMAALGMGSRSDYLHLPGGLICIAGAPNLHNSHIPSGQLHHSCVLCRTRHRATLGVWGRRPGRNPGFPPHGRRPVRGDLGFAPFFGHTRPRNPAPRKAI